MFAFLENIGTFELLPEVASQAGTALARFKRDLSKTWDDTGMEREIRKLKEALPKDMSVSDVARIAAERMEKRIRENVAEAEKPESSEPQPVESPTRSEPDSTTAAPAAPATEPPPGAPGPASADAPASEAPSTSGVDPAKHFGPPNRVPRES